MPSSSSFVVSVAAAAALALASGTVLPSACADRPTLTCFITPTGASTSENAATAVAGTVTFTPEMYSNDGAHGDHGHLGHHGLHGHRGHHYRSHGHHGKHVCGARITGSVTGLAGQGIDEATKLLHHGWHVHQFGDISDNLGMATGGHYNPEGMDHGLPDSAGPRHAGDLGNLRPDAHGVATLDEVVGVDTRAVLGRGLIVHAAPDDGGQPTGNSGARLGQCVLGIATPPAKEM